MRVGPAASGQPGASGSWTLHTDGGARGNPGPAGAGCVLADPAGREVACIARYLGRLTNNEAEYRALLVGLELAEAQGVRTLKLCMDSELVVRQLQGRYKVSAEHLKGLYQEARRRLGGFKSVEIQHVYREQNARADQLANQGIDEGLSRTGGMG